VSTTCFYKPKQTIFPRKKSHLAIGSFQQQRQTSLSLFEARETRKQGGAEKKVASELRWKKAAICAKKRGKQQRFAEFTKDSAGGS